MKFDDFIQCCVMLRSLTEGFKKLDTNRTGTVTINYEQVISQHPIPHMSALSLPSQHAVSGDGY